MKFEFVIPTEIYTPEMVRLDRVGLTIRVEASDARKAQRRLEQALSKFISQSARENPTPSRVKKSGGRRT